MIGKALLAIVAALSVVAQAEAQPAKPGPGAAPRVDPPPSPTRVGNKDIQVRTSVSRTAMWIGDHVEFLIDVSLAPNMDVIDEDLSKEKLKLEGLEVSSASSERIAGESGSTTRRFHYDLTTYQTGEPSLTIGPQVVRYYVRRPGERPQDVQPAGEVQLAPLVVARRSTLPDELPGLHLRDIGAAAAPPSWLAAAKPAGIGLAVLAAAPLAVWGVGLARRARTKDRRPSARVVRSHARRAIDELRALDASTDAGRLAAYTHLDQAIRTHLSEKRGIPAQALSAREIATRLGDAPDAEATAELLTECERARYGPPARVPSLDRYTASLQRAEHVLGTSS